jgi:hypothetical protein
VFPRGILSTFNTLMRRSVEQEWRNETQPQITSDAHRGALTGKYQRLVSPGDMLTQSMFNAADSNQ